MSSYKLNPFTRKFDLIGISNILPGANISIDYTDPNNPVISASIGVVIPIVSNYSALPAANTVPGKFYWCSNSQGIWWVPGSVGGTYYNSGLYYSNGTTWEFVNVPYQATQSEVNAGVVTDKFVTPNTFANASKWATKQDSLNGTGFVRLNGTTLTYEEPIPNITTTQQLALVTASIPLGKQYYNTTLGVMFYWDGSKWGVIGKPNLTQAQVESMESSFGFTLKSGIEVFVTSVTTNRFIARKSHYSYLPAIIVIPNRFNWQSY